MFKSMMRFIFIAALSVSFTNCKQAKEPEQPNILFIAVDDLRPELRCYGASNIHSPNIDRLASQGTLFERAYCNVPVCGASRASMLSGVRPRRDRFVQYYTWQDNDAPGITSLPGYFKEKGYYTVSNGKVYHHLEDGAGSWSEAPWHPVQEAEDKNWRNYITQSNLNIAAENNGSALSYEQADVHDTAYFDGKTAQKTITDLQRLKEKGQPFFLAAGFLKPHLPFNAPTKYWDIYPYKSIKMPENPFFPETAPDAANHNWGELRSYEGIPKEGALTDSLARKLIQGYYACVSYTDAQIGRILDELERLGLKENTIVVLWGDHGWNLGEHGLWCKHCNFHNALNAPLIVTAPGIEGNKKINSLVEFVDIYPSLCELVGLEKPPHLQGKSFVNLMNGETDQTREVAFSRWIEGESVKTDNYLYTEWFDNDGNVYARMLYDHRNDPKELVNVAESPQYADVVEDLSQKIRENIQKVNADGIEPEKENAQ